MSAIKLITLDLDNTLWDVDSIIIKAEQDMVAWIAEQVPEGLPIYQGEQIGEIRARVFEEFAHQRHDLSFMRTQVLFAVFQRAGYPGREARSLAEAAFAVFFEGRNRVEFFPGAHDMLEALCQQFTVMALTNGNADIHRAGIGHYMAGAYSSADVGASKPHPDMFLAPLQALDLQPRQGIHVGDHLIDDVSGAHGVGMHSIWVNLKDRALTDEDPRPTRAVTDLSAVPQAIEEIASGA